MVCTKKQKDSPYATYVELNRKKEAVDIRVGDSNEGKCKHTSLGIYVMSRQYLIHMLSDCVTHNCIHFEREFLTRAQMDGHGRRLPVQRIRGQDRGYVRLFPLEHGYAR